MLRKSIQPETGNTPEVKESKVDQNHEQQLKALSDRLAQEQGSWLKELQTFIAAELTSILKKHDKQQVSAALQNLLSGQFEQFTSNQDLGKDLNKIQALLIAKEHDLRYREARAKTSPQVSLLLFKLAVIRNLIANAKQSGIELTISPETEQHLVLDNLFIFIPGKKYDFEDIWSSYNHLVNKYDIDTASDILEHSLLRFVGIDEFPGFCRWQQQMSDQNLTATKSVQSRGVVINVALHIEPGFFSLHLALSFENFLKFIRLLNEKEPNVAEQIASVSFAQETVLTTYSMRLNATLIYKILFSTEYQKVLSEMVSNQTILRNYQLQTQKKFHTHEAIQKAFETADPRINRKSPFVERALLKAFGIETKPTSTKYEAAKRYEGFTTETDFFLGIEMHDAMALVDAINASFPDAAKIIASGDGPNCVQQIAISNEVLMSQKFQIMFSKGLDIIAEHDKDLFEELRVKSGTLPRTTQQNAKALQDMAGEYKESDPKLSSSLSIYSSLVAQRKPKSELKDTEFEVRKAIYAHQSSAKTPQELNSFKQGTKSRIKGIFRQFDREEENLRYLRAENGQQLVTNIPSLTRTKRT